MGAARRPRGAVAAWQVRKGWLELGGAPVGKVGSGTLLTAVFPSAPPNEAQDTVLGGLEQCTPDGLRQRGIVNLDAQVCLFGASLRLAPSRTDLGGPDQDSELWR